jgi:hypothetical protein
VSVEHILAALETFGWKINYGVYWSACPATRELELGDFNDPAAGIVILHEVGHCLDASIALEAHNGELDYGNAGRTLRAECIAWMWALRKARSLGWKFDAEEWACFRESIGYYIDMAAATLVQVEDW